jgi:putative ABC transport system ATP-binding protein
MVRTSDSDMDPVVHCHQLTKAYGEGGARVAALRGVDLEVYRGELLMLSGPSGCGKTTFLSILSGLLNPDDGRCEVLGQDLSMLDEEHRDQFRGKTVGFVFQAFNLLPGLNAVDNVAVPLLLNGVRRPQATEQAHKLLGDVGLEDRRNHYPGQLSGGEQQRVAIARALVHRPPIIVCDEPTSNLDHATGHEVMGLLRQLCETSGTTVIVVTHDERIFPFADRVAHMDDGRITSADGNSPRLDS